VVGARDAHRGIVIPPARADVPLGTLGVKRRGGPEVKTLGRRGRGTLTFRPLGSCNDAFSLRRGHEARLTMAPCPTRARPPFVRAQSYRASGRSSSYAPAPPQAAHVTSPAAWGPLRRPLSVRRGDPPGNDRSGTPVPASGTGPYAAFHAPTRFAPIPRATLAAFGAGPDRGPARGGSHRRRAHGGRVRFWPASTERFVTDSTPRW
jgi:hypothetical protein